MIVGAAVPVAVTDASNVTADSTVDVPVGLGVNFGISVASGAGGPGKVFVGVELITAVSVFSTVSDGAGGLVVAVAASGVDDGSLVEVDVEDSVGGMGAMLTLSVEVVVDSLLGSIGAVPIDVADDSGVEVGAGVELSSVVEVEVPVFVGITVATGDVVVVVVDNDVGGFDPAVCVGTSTVSLFAAIASAVLAGPVSILIDGSPPSAAPEIVVAGVLTSFNVEKVR